MNDFHALKYATAIRDVKNGIAHNKTSHDARLVNHQHLSGGLLTKHFDYAQRILKQGY